MEHSLLFGVFFTSWVVAFCGALVTWRARVIDGSSRSPITAPYTLYVGIVLSAGFLVTLPSRPPFSSGHGLGNGLALGGLFGLAAAAIAVSCAADVGRDAGGGTVALRAAAAVATPYALALIMVCIPLLWLRTTLVDTLVGAAIGWLVTALTIGTALTARISSSRRALLPLAAGLGFAVTVCALAVLGELRSPVTFVSFATRVSWSVIGLTFASAIPFVLLVFALPDSILGTLILRVPLAAPIAVQMGRWTETDADKQLAVRSLRAAASTVFVLLLGRTLSARSQAHTSIFEVIALGSAIGLLVWWLCAERTRHETTDDSIARGWHQGGLAAFVMVVGVMFAYRLQAGVGVGLMLTAAWLVAGIAVCGALESLGGTAAAVVPAGQRASSPPSGTTTLRLLLAMLFGCVLLLYRLFTSRFGEGLFGVSLTDFYALCGFLSGALLPPVLAGYLLQARRADGAYAALGRLTVAGAASLLAPAVLVLLWDSRCALALFIGLALSVVTSDQSAQAARPPDPTSAGGSGTEQDARGATTAHAADGASPSVSAAGSTLAPGLIAIAIALALCQWTGHVTAWAELSRIQKTHLLGWSVATLIAIVLVADYGARASTWRRRKREALAAGKAPQGGAR